MATRAAPNPPNPESSGQVSVLGRVANQALNMNRAGPYDSPAAGPIRRREAERYLAGRWSATSISFSRILSIRSANEEVWMIRLNWLR
jgi:hypothetical protein